MAVNYGKQFEAKLKEDFLKIPGATIDRLYDQVSGMMGIRNICDFIGYMYPNIYYLEAKSVHGNTFPLTNLSQFEKLCSKTFIEGVRAGVIIWYVDVGRVIYVPIVTFKKIKEASFKSINIKTLNVNRYYIVDIPSKKKRVFMDSDYSVLRDVPEDVVIEEYNNK